MAVASTSSRPAEYLKAAAYCAAGVITAGAITAISISIAFIGAGFFLSLYYGPGGDLSVLIKWFSASFYTAAIGGIPASVYLIIKVTGPIFEEAKIHWDRARGS